MRARRKRWMALAAALALMLAGCVSGGGMPQPDGTAEAASSSVTEPALPNGFIRGMDVSSVISLEQSGVVFRNAAGEPQDLFLTLAQAGVNYIRVRVWNHPYDAEGHGYGGGNCDTAKAAVIGRRAAAQGMKLLVDFHYSDFWADPERQTPPQAWTDMGLEEKSAALYAFTVASLTEIIAAGGNVGMVQIGNEINGGLAGETAPACVVALLRSASEAVRDVSAAAHADIRVAVHYTDVKHPEGIRYYAALLVDENVDYDVFGVSYYPYWHGGTDNLRAVLSEIAGQYGKATAVLETAYPYTLEDGDGFPNVTGAQSNLTDYPVSVQGQYDCLRSVMRAACDAGALGVFYWEGAWIPVGRDAQRNRSLWEQYGSGWASSFAAAYDPDGAGRYYGGCSWDNQAMFDHEGRPLASLAAFGNE